MDGPREAGASPLEIWLFGDATVEVASRRLEEFDSPRLQRLLAHLLFHDGEPQPRARLAFELWPDSSEAQARTNLRHVLHDLRRAIPGIEQYVEITPTSLRWQTDGGAFVDVLAFLAARARADAASDPSKVRSALEEAVGLYRGISSALATTTGRSPNVSACNSSRSTRSIASPVLQRTLAILRRPSLMGKSCSGTTNFTRRRTAV